MAIRTPRKTKESNNKVSKKTTKASLNNFDSSETFNNTNNNNKSAITRKKEVLDLLQPRGEIKPKTDKQKELMGLIKDNDKQIIIVSGPAGCGKTLVTLSEALYLLMNESNKFEEISIFKSVTPLKGEEVGFLPGDITEKMRFFLLSYFIQIEKLIGKPRLEKLIEKEFLKLVPLGYIRGVSMSNKQIIIVDEFQNISIENAKTILTRIEEGAKLICLGDIRQQDSRGKNGLSFLVEHFKEIDNKIAVLEFNDSEVVRNPLISKILNVFEEKGF
jgi:phosphate starvation-inducible PhoH-like protein